MDLSHSCDRRSGGRGSHCHCTTSLLETGRENVAGHPHPPRNPSAPTEYSMVQEFQEVPPVTIVLYQVADALKSIEMETLETINPFTLAPWETRMQSDVEAMPDSQTVPGGSMQVAVSSSARNALVGFGVAIEKQPPRKLKLKTCSVTLGAKSKQNPFSAEMAAMAHVLNMLVGLKDYRVTLLTSNKAAALTMRNPRPQSGQEFACQTYKLINRLQRNGNRRNQPPG